MIIQGDILVDVPKAAAVCGAAGAGDVPSAWVSLSGLPLQGQRVTREAHIDDAGVDRKEPFFVVAGVVSNPDVHDAKIEDEMFAISKALRPDKPFVRLSAKDIWHGSEEFARKYPRCVNKNARRKRLFQLVALIAEHKLPVVFGACEKKSVWRVPKRNWPPGRKFTEDIEELAHVQAQLSCSVRLEFWMRENLPNEVARVVHEDIPRARTPVEIAYNYCREPDVRAAPVGWNPPIADMIPFVKIRGQIRWANPYGERMLQLADACAFIISKHLKGDLKVRRLFDRLKPHLVAPDEINSIRRRKRRRQYGES
jgi:hypothetical protein